MDWAQGIVIGLECKPVKIMPTLRFPKYPLQSHQVPLWYIVPPLRVAALEKTFI